MKTILDLHDNQILKIVSNPIIGSLQLIITYGSDKILEIYISEIKKNNSRKYRMHFFIF